MTGTSIKDFCRNNNLSEPTFRYHMKKVVIKPINIDLKSRNKSFIYNESDLFKIKREMHQYRRKSRDISHQHKCEKAVEEFAHQKEQRQINATIKSLSVYG